ncbi:MAG: Ca-activated chloride channel family protein, partial [Arenicella sp.]
MRKIYPLLALITIFLVLILSSCHGGRQSCSAYGNATGWSYNGSSGALTGVQGRQSYSIASGEELKSDIMLRGEEKEQALIDLDPAQDVLYKRNSRQDRRYDTSIPDVARQYEQYESYEENKWVKTIDELQSTFGIDVDNASYTNFRRFINQGQLPPKDAIRIEEWLNFFNYELETPETSDVHPLKITTEISPCPWNTEDDLVMIKLKAIEVPEKEELPQSNLVFLIDVSGSMGDQNKLPLVKKSIHYLVNNLRAKDKISIVTYASQSKVILSPTAGNEKGKINKAVNQLSASGSTSGSRGIQKAYELAEKHMIEGGNNRVIVASDGDWNVGITNKDKLVEFISKKKESGIFLSVLGF